MSAPIMHLLLAVVVMALFGTTEAYGQEPPPAPTPTPHVGGRVFGVACQPALLTLRHGETGELGLADLTGANRVTMFRIGTVAGSADDADASEIVVVQRPASTSAGWSPLPGGILVSSTAVDGPPRTVTYYLNILLGGQVGEDVIVGGNVWCEVRVEHTLPPTIAVPIISISLPPMTDLECGPEQGAVCEPGMDLECGHPPAPGPNPVENEAGETPEPEFYFFSTSNLECLIRVLNSLPGNHRFWVFASALTDVSVIGSTAPPPTPTAPPTPPAIQPELRANSPVVSGEQVVVEGSGFPPGEARKVILDPAGNAVYDITITIGADGILHADFYIPGPSGTWRIVVYTSMGVIETTFEVIS